MEFCDLCPRLLGGVDLAQAGQALRGGHYYGMQSTHLHRGGLAPKRAVVLKGLWASQLNIETALQIWG